jgi:RHS repeat-associated protein
VDEIFSRTDTSSRSFLSDGLGTTLALTDPTGVIATQYTYEPFGNASTSGSISSNSFQYTGRDNDGTGLYFYRDRYYAPVAQRFVSQDPIGFRGGSTNLYSYALGSPTNFTDPSGDQAEEAAWICAVQPELCLAVAGGAIITYPIWAPMLSKGINNLGNSLALSTPISTPADPNGRKGEPPNSKKRCFDNNDIAQAQQEYPDKSGQQVHHRIPRFMEGSDDPSNLFPLPAAYHQLITNAWRDKFGYKNDPWFNRPSDPQEIEDFAKQLEEKYPLERCN